ncbi:phage tail assembly chaperone [Flintibacter porci]|uniref:phage tail assembly chaperone n=1 Tax=Flintibacter porci TaxID=3342383 RepID=UPI003F8A8FE4
MVVKQMEVTEKKIGENTFYIKPFAAFTAVNISGELAAVITPLLGGLAALLGSGDGDQEEGKNIMDVQVEDALPAVTQAFSSISGDKFERLMKKLLIDHKNISVEGESTEGDLKPLTFDLANEVFCGEVQDMYILCFEVIRLNFKGFFSKISTQFGDLTSLVQKKVQGTQSMEN